MFELPGNPRAPRTRWPLALGVASCLLWAAPLVRVWSDEGKSPATKTDEEGPAGSEAKIDPLSVNASCYVCHIPFVREEISRVHFAEEITCIKCHGLSADHANDEDIGATKPDIIYARAEIDAACRKCHEEHDVEARDVIARWLRRRPPSPPVCTDCHGTHRIADAAEEPKPASAGKPTP